MAVHRTKRRREGLGPRFLAVDFFCGAGGTSRGLIAAGGYVIAGIDKDGRCERTYSANNRNESLDYAATRFLNFDIFPRSRDYPDGEQRELVEKLSGLISYYRGKAKRVPLLFAICDPCQPFTKLSRKELTEKRRAGRDRDANLLSEACKFVKTFQPEVVLSENVSGIGDPKYGGVWEVFRRKLTRLGYATGSKTICASRFGVPQFRKRSILLAVRHDLVKPERFADIFGTELLVPDADPDAPIISVEEAIGHLPTIGAGEAHPFVPNHRTRTLARSI